MAQPSKEDLHARIENDLNYHAPDNADVERHSAIRHAGLELGHQLIDICPLSRELSTALTRLEECLFHANAAVARTVDW